MNGLIASIKMIYVLCIVVMHWGIPFSGAKCFLEGAYIFVDFFFIVQGFYLCKYYDKDVERTQSVSIGPYLKYRCLRFMPLIYLQAVVLAMIEFLFYCHSIKNFMRTAWGTLIQFSFISVLLPRNLLNNGTMWFISASVIVGCVVYYLIRRLGRMFAFFAPFIASFLYNYMINEHGNLDLWNQMGVSGGCSFATIRAFAGMCLGVFLESAILFFTENFKCNHIPQFLKKMMLVCGGGGVFIVTLIFSVLVPHTRYDFFQIIAFAAMIIICNTKGNLVSGRIFKTFNDYTFPLFAWQCVSIRIVSLFVTPGWVSAFFVVMLDIAISTLWLIEHKTHNLVHTSRYL